MGKRSLNGGETKPLTVHGYAALVRLLEGPILRSSVNPGVKDRLTREPEPLAMEDETRMLHITEAGKTAAGKKDMIMSSRKPSGCP